MADTESEAGAPRGGSHGIVAVALARGLGLFAQVEPAEVASTLILTLDVFLVLMAYYFLKTVREPLILAGGNLTIGSLSIGPAELKTYASTGQAVLLIGLVRVYAALAQRFGRMALSTIVLVFFASNLVIFYVLARLSVPVGIPFYLWVGCFSLTVIAQFWSFANDVYTPAQGKRLFAIIGVGSSLGAVFGSRIAKSIFEPVGPTGMMLLAAAVLFVCLGATWVVHRMATDRAKAGPARKDAPPGAGEGLRMVVKDRYLALIALLMLFLNWVNTSGEYILDRTLVDAAAAQGLTGDAAKNFIGTFKAGYFFWVNIIGLGLQLFLTSRIFKYLGVRVAVLFLPLVAMGGYAVSAFLPILGVIRIGKIVENSIDYSIQNTARQALFLPTSRAAKYTGKAAIDTFVTRAGDVMSAVVVAIGTALSFGTKHFALINVGLAAGWLVVAFAVGRRHDVEAEKVEAEKKEQTETPDEKDAKEKSKPSAA